MCPKHNRQELAGKKEGVKDVGRKETKQTNKMVFRFGRMPGDHEVNEAKRSKVGPSDDKARNEKRFFDKTVTIDEKLLLIQGVNFAAETSCLRRRVAEMTKEAASQDAAAHSDDLACSMREVAVTCLKILEGRSTLPEAMGVLRIHSSNHPHYREYIKHFKERVNNKNLHKIGLTLLYHVRFPKGEDVVNML